MGHLDEAECVVTLALSTWRRMAVMMFRSTCSDHVETGLASVHFATASAQWALVRWTYHIGMSIEK